MADEDKPRTFTEGEAYALVADAVSRETAAAVAEVETLKAQNATLSTERDAMEVRATAAEDKAAAAEAAFESYKVEAETQKAAEARRTERVAKVTEVAPKLEITKERSDRIVAMEEPAFTDYLEQLSQVAGVEAPKGGGVPRESAAFQGGKPGDGDKPTASVSGLFAARRGQAQKTA